METNPSSAGETAVPAKRPRTKFLAGVACCCAGLLLTQVNQFAARHDGSAAFELGLILAGWALAGLSFLYANRHAPEDELEMLINRRALAFAYYVMIFGLLALDGLQSAGFVPRFEWQNTQLVGVLVLLWLTGFVFSKSRFR